MHDEEFGHWVRLYRLAWNVKRAWVSTGVGVVFDHTHMDRDERESLSMYPLYILNHLASGASLWVVFPTQHKRRARKTSLNGHIYMNAKP